MRQLSSRHARLLHWLARGPSTPSQCSIPQVACQQHWSGWQRGSPHTMPAGDGTGGMCSTACTREGTLQLLRQTGAFDQYNQALVAASYGALSLSADVAVLPEVLLPRDTPDTASNFTYYETPAVQVRRKLGRGAVGQGLVACWARRRSRRRPTRPPCPCTGTLHSRHPPLALWRLPHLLCRHWQPRATPHGCILRSSRWPTTAPRPSAPGAAAGPLAAPSSRSASQPSIMPCTKRATASTCATPTCTA